MADVLAAVLALAIAIPAAATAPGAWDPRAAPGAVVVAGHGGARFTLLTDRLLRMEAAPGGVFEDRASLVT